MLRGILRERFKRPTGNLRRKAPREWLQPAGVAQRSLDVDLRHALPPVVAEVGVVEWSRGFVGDLRHLRDQVLVRASPLEWRQKGADVDRMRADGAERPAGLAHDATIPRQRDGHAEDGKVE